MGVDQGSTNDKTLRAQEIGLQGRLRTILRTIHAEYTVWHCYTGVV
jgi:hypothetical protein